MGAYGAPGMSHIEAHILQLVAKLFPQPFAALDQFCSTHRSFVDETIRLFDQEAQFYVAYLGYVSEMRQKGLPFCFPEVGAHSKSIYADDTFDLALADRLTKQGSEVIRNSFYLDGDERVIVVSGPNQGGKTTFARTFGQLHYLACLGCPVPGTRARLYLFDRLMTHFEKEEQISNLRGKLQDDLIRISDIMKQATPDSIIILNELFSSTTLDDAVFLSKEIMVRILHLDLLCVWVTFIDELSTMSSKTVSMVSTVVPDNPALRTFRIVRKPADGLAYAITLAEKHQLTYEQIRRRIKACKSI